MVIMCQIDNQKQKADIFSFKMAHINKFTTEKFISEIKV